jgi:hypothetical protein
MADRVGAVRALAAAFGLTGVVASAAVIDGVNWADDAVAYSANIQNYGGELLSDATKWWITGPPDADANGNGYAFDSVDQDAVAGWRSAAPGEYITMYWATGIPDVPGDDVTLRYFAGPNALADVYASVDGVSFTSLGVIGGGTSGYFRDATIDLGGFFAADVHFVKVVRAASGPNTGMFFDAFAGVVVPEPAGLTLLVPPALALWRRRG